MAENINETTYTPMEMPDEEILNDQFDEDIEVKTAEVREYNLFRFHAWHLFMAFIQHS